MTDYALIGDIHSQITPLRNAIRYCEENNLFPVFLGDVFDSRCAQSDSVSVYFTLRELCEKKQAIVLRSNHQDKLEKYIRGISAHTPTEMLRTVDEMEAGGVYMWDLLKWLESLPHGFCFKRGDQEWRCAHAFFPSWLDVPEYEESCEVRPEAKAAKRIMMYGPSHAEGKGRVFWWEKKSKREWIRTAGHYHTIHSSENNLVLDGGCGGEKRSWFCNEPAVLVLFDVAKKEMVEFTL
jgi:hypothetical protein